MFVVNMVVDSDVYNFKDLVDKIVEKKYHPDHHELVIVAYYDADSKKPFSSENRPRIACDVCQTC